MFRQPVVNVGVAIPRDLKKRLDDEARRQMTSRRPQSFAGHSPRISSLNPSPSPSLRPAPQHDTATAGLVRECGLVATRETPAWGEPGFRLRLEGLSGVGLGRSSVNLIFGLCFCSDWMPKNYRSTIKAMRSTSGTPMRQRRIGIAATPICPVH